MLISRPPLRTCVLVAITGLITIGNASGQSSELHCASNTATNATLILPETLEVQMGEEPLSPPLLLTVINEEGTCAGAGIWNKADTALTVWGREETPAIPAVGNGPLAPGDSLRIRVYDPEGDRLYGTASASHLAFRRPTPSFAADPRYVPDGLYVVDRIQLRP